MRTHRGIDLSDSSRFRVIARGESALLFDAVGLDVYPMDEVGDEDMPALLGEIADAPPAPDLDARTRTRISNLKLATSGRCPSDCAYCFRKNRSDAPAPLGIATRALEAMAMDFGRDAPRYTLSFNLTSEPLADLPALREAREACLSVSQRHGKDAHLYLCSSGTIESEPALDEALRALGEYRLAVSVDGPREVHDRFRRDRAGRGTYDRALALASRVRERGNGTEAEAVLTRAFPRPDLVLGHLLAEGFDAVSMKPVRPPFEYAFRIEDLPELLSAYDRIFDGLERDFAAGDFGLLKRMRHDFCLRPLWKLAFRIRATRRCIWGTTHVIVDARGDYYPCDAVIGDAAYACGSLDRGLDWERFHADRSVELRGACARCWAKGLCGGTCYATAIATSGAAVAIDPVECGLTRRFAERCVRLVAALGDSGAPADSLKAALLDY